MKKYKIILITIISAAILGFLMSILKHTGLWIKLTSSLKSYNIFLYILSPFLFFFIGILVHELGHLLSFIFNKIKIRALFVLIFIFKRNKNNKWVFQIKPSNIKLLGGLVVPNLPVIKTEEEYLDIKNKFTKALIAGPIISIIYLVVSILSFILIWLFTNNQFLISTLFLQMIFISLMTLLIIASSKVHTDELYGDFVAHKKFKEDEIFAIAQINQYTMFSLTESKETEDFFFNKIISIYANKELAAHSIFDYNLLASYISHNLSLDKLDLSLDSYISKFNIYTLSRSKHGYELGFLISAYYYKKEDVKTSYEIYHKISNMNNSYFTTLESTLIKKEYAHLINLENNESYFDEHKDYMFSDLELLSPVIDFDKLFEDKKKVLTFVPYYSNIDLNNIVEKEEN